MNWIGIVRSHFANVIAVLFFGLTGCAQDSARIDLTTYSPVIDVKGHGYDMADYQ